jgi:hypothetical protein
MDKLITVKATVGSTDYCFNEPCSSLQVQSYIIQLGEVSLFPNHHLH